jgi:hypothetical protein
VTGADIDAALDAALALGADGWFCFPCLKDKRRQRRMASRRRRAIRIVCANCGGNIPLLWLASQPAPPQVSTSSTSIASISKRSTVDRKPGSPAAKPVPSHAFRGTPPAVSACRRPAFHCRQDRPRRRYAGRWWLHHLVAGRQVAGVERCLASGLARMVARPTADPASGVS